MASTLIGIFFFAANVGFAVFNALTGKPGYAAISSAAAAVILGSILSGAG